ncbi:F-box/kelch-repeat protein At3g23880-like [Lotus japonicus]|uniref:F-box/kelch-repeat protein At3g23880-like n=1 Tax=Lotus japonicus TaxID=34305 RepID=UPI0025898B81|nr:F-box/kelch-repeat protein At3g23880-like [Lotus japonicus]
MKIPVGEAELLPPPILIPDELIREILLLLPVKSLMRFRFVCKSWNLIISNPQFVKRHLRCSLDNNIRDFAHIQLLSESYNAGNESLDQSYVSIYSIPLLFSSQKGNLYPIESGYNLIGVCNGLVSFAKRRYFYSENVSSYSCWVRLWNPITGLWSMSPPLTFSRQPFEDNSDDSFGFGYDCMNETYKMVAIMDMRNSLEEEPEKNVVKIYDMGSTCWRRIQSFPDLPNRVWPSAMSNGVYASGALNWLILTKTKTFIVVSLNLGREEYLQLSLPPSSQHAKDRCFPLLDVLKDSLCILQNDGEKGFVVWQMKEFGAQASWTKLFNFRFERNLAHMIPYFSPMQFILSEINEVLLMSYNELVLYNHRDNTFKVSHRASQYAWIVHNYIGSLVSPY